MKHFPVQITGYKPHCPDRFLWLMVLWQAVQDATRTPRCSKSDEIIIKNAQNWFYSERRTPTSFLWVCEIFNLSPEKVRRFVKGEREIYQDKARLMNAIKFFRKQKNITQIEFAEIVGTNSSYLSNVERGICPESRIPKDLKIRIWQIIKGEDYGNSNFAYQ